MPTYVVTRPWNATVKKGQRLDLETLHPSLVAHVVLLPEDPDGGATGDEGEAKPVTAGKGKGKGAAKAPAKPEKTPPPADEGGGAEETGNGEGAGEETDGPGENS